MDVQRACRASNVEKVAIVESKDDTGVSVERGATGRSCVVRPSAHKIMGRMVDVGRTRTYRIGSFRTAGGGVERKGNHLPLPLAPFPHGKKTLCLGSRTTILPASFCVLLQ